MNGGEADVWKKLPLTPDFRFVRGLLPFHTLGGTIQLQIYIAPVHVSKINGVATLLVPQMDI